jgi:hypothetical protein
VNLPGERNFLFVRSLIGFTQKKGESFLIDDVESTERAEKSIDAFINKTARNKAEANQEEALWKASTRLANAKRRRENRKLWIDHHGVMNVLHTGLALEHASKRARLLAEGGYEPEESPGPEAA